MLSTSKLLSKHVRLLARLLLHHTASTACTQCLHPGLCTCLQVLRLCDLQVISAVTRVDERGQFVTEQRGLMEKFASHTELGEECVSELQNWVSVEAGMQYSN